MTKLRLKRTETVSIESLPFDQSHGILTEWNDERGYGFITPYDGGEKVFLHIKSLLQSARRPVIGELFFYKLTTDDKGRPRAEQAFQKTLDEKRCTPFTHSIIKGLSFFWPLAFIPAIAITAKTGRLAVGFCAAYIINSLLTILLYWEDKHLAQYKYWRIPEKCLHIWEFLCGWPGALYAQQAFRHKRSKTSFLVVFWLCAIANVIALVLLLSYGGSTAIGDKVRAWWQEVSALYD